MRLFSISGKTPLERLIRMLAMLLVVALVGWAFWQNNRNMLERIYADKPLWDETGKLEPQLRAYAKDFSRTMRESFGIDARVRIRKSAVSRPEPVQGRLFLGISPEERQVVFVAPPEWDPEKARELQDYLEHKHFERHWDKNWQTGLKSALVLIWNQQRDRGASLEQAMDENAPLLDETGSLDEQTRSFVMRFAEALERDFAQKAVVRIFSDKIIVPDLDNQTMFLGIAPKTRQVIVSFPPIMRRALGADFERELMTRHFDEYFASGDWPLGLKTALIQIWQTLAGEELK
ncbi:hypothetical protein [Paucidesulfovibrio longus]|uniref:hypothetical protein n=1 Tax=Paucidesulfovibrio longus TaxID=889 RepID=UPI0003B56DC3|nr:hypothetical protein [Paucidesulfovibrio longus]